jgi:hypothetical protein
MEGLDAQPPTSSKHSQIPELNSPAFSLTGGNDMGRRTS